MKTNMASSYTSSPRYINDTDYDDVDSLDLDDDRDFDENFTDEAMASFNTEDASETDMVKRETEYTEIKEQMYQDKLAHLKKQLQQLEEGTLPEYIKKRKKIDQNYKERIRINEIWREFELDVVEREYIKEKKASVKDFEEKKIELKENLILEFEEKKKNIENERNSMDLTGGFLLSDSMEIKPVTTRKLRRRPNDPMPLPEKRRKQTPAQLNLYLDEGDILDDLRIINKVSGKPVSKKVTPHPSPIEAIIAEAKIDDGRLYYDKRWFHRNQPVFVESKDMGKFTGVITAVGTQEIWIRKIPDNCKMRISVGQLEKGQIFLRRR
ncbi:sin3 histone deacetylase corepressor complex component SDS3-like isoform X1 [Saccostrea echinata]|uniref:sin3 histone deacetylase corepressor complex component SDS3-like isoform X1 n=1 Tax=Saccostrea echinata TaxID=191078 RepID=UPI002A8401A8|nr:sin3 histone deacetylase corepressor complex component SDS3-like isoform X1 [Saccostrea echinata]XP_061166297.1 sin3 histone deacetylase corepressor complex component SDS3-like isoform X1 [Saccostrea echinata]